MSIYKEVVKLYYNATIYTVEEEMPYADAMAIEGKHIISIGSYDFVREKIKEKKFEEFNLDGNFVMPGFVESHAHPSLAGPEMLYQIDLSDCFTKENYLIKIKEFYQNNPDISIIRGVGWINPAFEKNGPKKEWLDEISNNIPIILTSGDHHSLWVNSKALQLANVDFTTEDIPGGVIERNTSTMEPSGTLREEAQSLITNKFSDYSIEEYEKAWLYYQNAMAKFGITMVHDAWLNLLSNSHKAVYNLAKENRLLFKVSASIYTYANNPSYIDSIIKEGKNFNINSFTVNHAKFFLDGVIEGGTACLKSPYSNNKEKYGEKLWEDTNLLTALLKLDNADFWPHFHIIGDAVMTQALDILEKVININGIKDRRIIGAHAQIVDETDKKRIGNVGMTISANPYWFIKDKGYYYEIEEPSLGTERASNEYPMKSLINEGIIVASASDFSVTPNPNPLKGIMTGVLRCLPNERDKPDRILGVNERATVPEMIKSFTLNGAYTMNKEKETGSLKVGKYADFIVINKNILEIPVHEIVSAKVIKVFSEGTLIYEAK